MQNFSLGFWIPGTNPNEPSLYEALRSYPLVSLLGGKGNFKKHQERGQLLKVSNQDYPQRVVKRSQNGGHNGDSMIHLFFLTGAALISPWWLPSLLLWWQPVDSAGSNYQLRHWIICCWVGKNWSQYYESGAGRWLLAVSDWFLLVFLAAAWNNKHTKRASLVPSALQLPLAATHLLPKAGLICAMNPVVHL